MNGKLIRIKIWDTAGQEQYKSITKNFFRNANGVMVVFDVTSKTSFEKIQDWVHSIKESTTNSIKTILLANKIDLERKVTTEEGQKLADHYQMSYFETSAKNNVGINEAIRSLVASIYGIKDNENENEIFGNFNLTDRKSIKREKQESKSKCKC
jgi:small GTP-binding protein